MYFPDLSPYKYSTAVTTGSNIGWLDGIHTFPTGKINSEVITKLKQLAIIPKNTMRGWHDCEICKNIHGKTQRVASGNGEIYIPTGKSPRGIYVAPVLIIHYIEAHQYKPPQQFIDAVLALPEY